MRALYLLIVSTMALAFGIFLARHPNKVLNALWPPDDPAVQLISDDSRQQALVIIKGVSLVAVSVGLISLLSLFFS